MGEDLCPALGLTIPVGKDSMSMKTCWQEGNEEREMTSPLSLVISAFARVEDVRHTITPQLSTEDNALLLIDLGKGNNALGATALAQVYRQLGDKPADVRDVAQLKGFYDAIQALVAQRKLLAYHDRSDGGLLVTLAFYLVIYRLQPASVHITRKGLHGARGITARLYAVGIPAALNLALPSLLISCLNALLAELSQAYVVVLGIYYKLQTFLYLPASGIIQGMRPVIGYNYGAGERERVSRIFQVALALCACIMMIGTVLCLAFASPLMALFTENVRTVVIGAHALRIICVGFLVSAVSVTASGALEGLGKGTASLVISLCRYTVVILPIAVVLCKIMGANGVWHAFWVTEFISAGVALVAWKRV